MIAQKPSTKLALPRCGGRARPAILMFEDNDWVDSALQDRRYREWTAAVRWLATETRSASNPLRVVILEVGAGGNVTTSGTSRSTCSQRRCRGDHLNQGEPRVAAAGQRRLTNAAGGPRHPLYQWPAGSTWHRIDAAPARAAAGFGEPRGVHSAGGLRGDRRRARGHPPLRSDVT